MIAKMLPLSIAIATSTLALCYAMGGLLAEALLIAALGTLWLLGQRQGWRWIASATLIFFAAAALLGLARNLGDGWMLFSVVAALSAWDLDHFVRRQRSVGRVENERELERGHLQRLLIVDSLGLLLGAIALGVNIRFGFCTAFLLALLAVLGLSRGVSFLRRESN